MTATTPTITLRSIALRGLLVLLFQVGLPGLLTAQPTSGQIFLPINEWMPLEGTASIRLEIEGKVDLPAGEGLYVWSSDGAISYGGEITSVDHPDPTLSSITVQLEFHPEIEPELVVLYGDTDTSGWHPLRRAAAAGLYIGPGIGRSLRGHDVLSGSADYGEIIRELVTEIREMGESFGTDSISDPELHTPVAWGNFTGITLVAGLERADSASVVRCVEYFLSDPTRFRGRSVNIVQAYAWWVAFGGPISPDQILGTLTTIDDPTARRRFMDQHRRDIVEYAWLDRWITYAETIGTGGDLPSAWTVLRIALDGAERYERSGDIGWGYFVAGELYEREDSLRHALESYVRAIDAFNPETDGLVGPAYSHNNAGSVARRLFLYDDALNHYDRSIELKHIGASRSP